MNLVWFFADGFSEYNSSHFRATIFVNALKKAGHNAQLVHIRNWIDDTEKARLLCSTADVIIIQRVMVQESIDRALFWIRHGKKVVVDFDDAYDLIGPENPAYKFWGKGDVEVNTPGGSFIRPMEPHPIEQFSTALGTISGGIVPSRNLQEDWSVYGRIYYLPNYLDTPRYTFLKKKENEKLTIAWGGSMSHLTSFEKSGAAEALAQLLGERSDIRLMIVGDERVVPLIPVPREKIFYRPYVMWFDWPEILSFYDIGLAPLAEPYDQRRSRLKVAEYLARGIPFVATKSRTYTDFFEARSGRFIDQGNLNECTEPNPEKWYAALSLLANNYETYLNVAKDEAQNFFYMYDVDENIPYIETLFREILNG